MGKYTPKTETHKYLLIDLNNINETVHIYYSEKNISGWVKKIVAVKDIVLYFRLSNNNTISCI